MKTSLTGVRARLLALLFIASVPVLATAISGAWDGYRRALRDIADQASLLGEAEAARHAVALGDMRGMLLGLAATPAMAGPDCGAGLGMFSRLLAGRYSDIWLTDAQGVLRCDTRGSAPGRALETTRIGGMLARGADYALGDFGRSGSGAGMVLPAVAAIRRDGVLVGQAGAAITADWFARPGGPRLPAEASHHSWLLGAGGDSFALGGQPDSDLPEAAVLRGWQDGAKALTTLRGSRAGPTFAYAWRPVLDGMSLLVAVSAEDALAAADADFRWRLGEVLAQIALCLAALAVGAEMTCARPMRSLAAALRHWQHGQDFSPPRGPWDPWEVSALGDTLAEAATGIAHRETALRAMVSERDRMLGEIHHRVKNSLQVAASMLSLHAALVANREAREEIGLAHERIQTLALLHRHLYATAELDEVALAPLLRDVVSLALDGMAVPWTVEARQATLRVEQATPLAMLLAEVLHLVRAGGAGLRVDVVLRCEDGRMTMEVLVANPNPGAPAAEARLSVAGVLMQGFAEQLGAALPVAATQGGSFAIGFAVLRESAALQG